jgi:hypothetical protein
MDRAVSLFRNQFFLLSHFWLATVQLVLQADWHDVWHSPQALPFAGWQLLLPTNVFMWVMGIPSNPLAGFTQ